MQNHYFATDKTRELLKRLSWMPKGDYEIKNEKIFVFEKLARLVTTRIKSDHSQLEAVAMELFDKALVSPHEAASQWGIVPRPYRIVEAPNGGLMLFHAPFNARLPVLYASRVEAIPALAKILSGEIIHGRGGFTYKSQPMVLLSPVKPDSLPPNPLTHAAAACKRKPAKTLKGRFLEGVEFIHGFDPVSYQDFCAIKEAEREWQRINAVIAPNLAFTESLWERISEFKLESLNSSEYLLLDHAGHRLSQLRGFYPELGMLNDSTLYNLFNIFQYSSKYNSTWSPYRDVYFAFYLLGRLIGGRHEHYMVMDVGKWVAHFFLNEGKDVHTALANARAAAAYENALMLLTLRISDAMSFLAKENERQIEQDNARLDGLHFNVSGVNKNDAIELLAQSMFNTDADTAVRLADSLIKLTGNRN